MQKSGHPVTDMKQRIVGSVVTTAAFSQEWAVDEALGIASRGKVVNLSPHVTCRHIRTWCGWGEGGGVGYASYRYMDSTLIVVLLSSPERPVVGSIYRAASVVTDANHDTVIYHP